jgi:mono/diheme cytochrome c family protein
LHFLLTKADSTYTKNPLLLDYCPGLLAKSFKAEAAHDDKRARMRCMFVLVSTCLLVASDPALPQVSEARQGAPETVFEQNCAVCHNNPATRAPARASLHAMSPNFIVEALTNGIMKDPGSVLSPEQRVALAEFLTGKKVGAEATMAGRCRDTPPSFSLEEPSFNG